MNSMSPLTCFFIFFKTFFCRLSEKAWAKKVSNFCNNISHEWGATLLYQDLPFPPWHPSKLTRKASAALLVHIFQTVTWFWKGQDEKESVLHPGVYTATKPRKSATQKQQLMLNSCRKDKLLLPWHRCHYIFTGQYFLLHKNARKSKWVF